MIHNKEFVEAVKLEQKRRGITQVEFAEYIGVSQGALSKFYKRGVRDGIVIRVLTRFPELAYFFAVKNSNCN